MKKQPDLCVFCCKGPEEGEMDREHVCPKGAWEKGGRPNHAQTTVPAHKKCNRAMSADNEYFRDVLVFDAATSGHPEVQKLRSGSVGRKIQEKPGAIAQLLSRSKVVPEMSPGGIIIGQKEVFAIDRERIDRVLYNSMRAVFFTVNNVPMPTEWSWGIKSIEEIEPDVIELIEEQMGPAWHTFGDDVFMCKYVFDYEHGGAISCLMSFYKSRIFWGWAQSDEFIQYECARIQESLLIEPASDSALPE